MSGATTGNAKALIGVLFLQWVVYALFYLADQFYDIAPSHYKEFKRLNAEEEDQKDEDSEPGN